MVFCYRKNTTVKTVSKLKKNNWLQFRFIKEQLPKIKKSINMIILKYTIVLILILYFVVKK